MQSKVLETTNRESIIQDQRDNFQTGVNFQVRGATWFLDDDDDKLPFAAEVSPQVSPQIDTSEENYYFWSHDWLPSWQAYPWLSDDETSSVEDYELPLEGMESEGEGNKVGTFGGGFGNEALGSSSYVAAGVVNSARGSESFIGAGVTNEAQGDSSFIGAGDVNTALGANSFIGSGLDGVASGDSSFIGSGTLNVASGKYSFIGGGYSNVASGFASAIIGGIHNFAGHDNSFVFGGTMETHCTSSAANQFKVCSKESLFDNVVVDGKLTLGPFTDVAAELEDALARADLAVRFAFISLAFNIALWVVVMLFLIKQLRRNIVENIKKKEGPSSNGYQLLPHEKQDPVMEALLIGPTLQTELDNQWITGSYLQEHLIQVQVDN